MAVGLVSETQGQKSGYKDRGTLVGQRKRRRANCMTRLVLKLTCHLNPKGQSNDLSEQLKHFLPQVGLAQEVKWIKGGGARGKIR